MTMLGPDPVESGVALATSGALDASALAVGVAFATVWPATSKGGALASAALGSVSVSSDVALPPWQGAGPPATTFHRSPRTWIVVAG